MRIRKTVLAIGAAALVAGLAGCNNQTRTVVNLPYCPQHVNVCVLSMGVYSAPHESFIKGIISVKTQHRPRAFELYAFMYVRQPSGWKVQDQRIYHLSALPPVGKTGNLLPVLENVCESRPWVLDLHFIGTSDTGGHYSDWFVWPGANYRPASFLASESIIPQRYWPTRPPHKC